MYKLQYQTLTGKGDTIITEDEDFCSSGVGNYFCFPKNKTRSNIIFCSKNALGLMFMEIRY